MKTFCLTDHYIIMSCGSITKTLNSINIFKYKLQQDTESGRRFLYLEDDDAVLFELMGGIPFLWKAYRNPEVIKLWEM